MEHLRAPCTIYNQAKTTGHHTRMDNFSIVNKVYHNIERTIKEAIYVTVNESSLNRNIGKYQLSHI